MDDKNEKVGHRVSRRRRDVPKRGGCRVPHAIGKCGDDEGGGVSRSEVIECFDDGRRKNVPRCRVLLQKVYNGLVMIDR